MGNYCSSQVEIALRIRVTDTERVDIEDVSYVIVTDVLEVP
jgi:hypothetical protein